MGMATIVLVDPQIPQNTGTIARLCAATGTPLVLVGTLGFSLSDKYLKRAGLDYWDEVQWRHEPDTAHFFDDIASTASMWFFSSRATMAYTDVAYPPNSYMIFGSETDGLPAWIKDRFMDRLVTIPMVNKRVRSLNLANAVSVGLYEVIRQQGLALAEGAAV